MFEKSFLFLTLQSYNIKQSMFIIHAFRELQLKYFGRIVYQNVIDSNEADQFN